MTPDSQHPADYLIDRTLNALREAQPRAGAEAMNRRLLATLQPRELATARPAAANIPVWQRLRRSPIAAFALSAAAILLIAVAILLPRTRTTSTAAAPPTQTPNQAQAVMDPTALHPVTQPRQGVPDTGVPSERISSLGWHISLLRCGPATTSNCARPRELTLATETTPALTEQAMLDDLHAPSQPTPHMPLTREERLLIRAARQGTEVQLAQLEALPRPPARDHAIAQYIHRMLAPLAMAEALDPTPQPEPEPDGAPATTAVPDQTPLSPR